MKIYKDTLIVRNCHTCPEEQDGICMMTGETIPDEGIHPGCELEDMDDWVERGR
jgi:hypothetical protein